MVLKGTSFTNLLLFSTKHTLIFNFFYRFIHLKSVKPLFINIAKCHVERSIFIEKHFKNEPKHTIKHRQQSSKLIKLKRFPYN